MPRIGRRLRMASVLAMIGLLALAAACLAWRIGPREESEARRAVSSGRYDEAAEVLNRRLRQAPESAEAHLLMGRLAVAKNRLPEAVEELKRAQSLGGARDGLVLLRALIAAKAGRHVEAEPALRQAFESGGAPDLQVDEALARVYLETFDFRRAGAVLDRWARDFPADPKPHLWRAEVHSRDGNEVGLVMDDYREALRRDPNLAPARLGLAQELRKAHRNAEAAVEYDAYLALRPDDASARLGAGENLMELGDDATALRHLRRAIELDGEKAGAHKDMAELSARRGDWTTAMAHLDRAMALDPYDVSIRHRRGMALVRLGRPDEARAEQAVADRLREDLHRLNAARARLMAAPHDRQSQLEVARWMFDHGHEAEGARWAEKILAERPLDAEAGQLLADYHLRRGEKGLANRYRLNQTNGAGASPPAAKTP